MSDGDCNQGLTLSLGISVSLVLNPWKCWMEVQSRFDCIPGNVGVPLYYTPRNVTWSCNQGLTVPLGMLIILVLYP